jgi:hypothetical protein
MPYSAIMLVQSESLCAVAVEVPTIVASDVTGRAQVAQPGIEDASRVVGHSDRTVPSTDICVRQDTINVAFHHRRMLTSLGSRRLGASDHPLIRFALILLADAIFIEC